ncbi:uncharacterized protein OCT59_000974 [Rhizophagus irregularis]|uniref:Btb/poz domain containing protein n=2 Tax=Rhizophagus irregularis TaxID=588596 RepID=A0A015K754_RHIIW|nr:hypothetical protein RirG_226970 [Rhizophagus irregularis DAOM 197198w]UZN99707.1 hypothetical protein OCT59_000974 [Rhizophagus irregularis]
MARGYSLSQDLKLLVNNPKYSDIEILCKDEKKLYGCRAILAARSEVLEGLLYNGMKESFEGKISFPAIDSSGMKILLEYIYVGSLREDSLTKENIVEAYYAADYFQIQSLQELIIKTLKNTLARNYAKNYSPELLSKVAEIMPLTEDNILLNLLVEAVAIMPLNNIEFDRLSIAGLKYLLSITHEKEKLFATSEYEVFRYSVILAAKQVSNDAYKTFIERLPTLGQVDNPIKVENKFIADIQKIAEELKTLIKFMDFRRIKAQIIANIIEPLEIIPAEIILSVYRNIALLNNSHLSNTRGISINESDYVWDKSASGSKLIIEDNGIIVRSLINKGLHHSVRGKKVLENNGIFEWDVIIEKDCKGVWVGVCSSVNFDYENPAGRQFTGWVLGSNGYCRNSGISSLENYCPPFHEDGARITVHLDMDKRTCSFTVNDTKYREVSEWNNLPSKLHPVVSLGYRSRCRIQPH